MIAFSTAAEVRRAWDAQRHTATELANEQASAAFQASDVARAMRTGQEVEAKAEDLLRREISVTQRLIKNTRTNDPRRPDFLLRLAEGYFELVQVNTRDVRKLDDPIHQACTVKKNFSAVEPGSETSASSPSQVLQTQPFLLSFCTQPARSPLE